LLIQEKKKKEDELLFMEENYQSLSEEIDALKGMIIHLREKYK
jgi:hypothetical protein